MLRTIARYPDPIEAHIVCGRLRAEGIDAQVADDQMNLANWEWRQALGGTRILVMEDDAMRARALIAEIDGGAFTLEDAPAPVADHETPSSRVAWVFAIMLGIPLPWRRRRAAPDEDSMQA